MIVYNEGSLVIVSKKYYVSLLCLPPSGSGETLFSPCVCLSVRPSVRLSVWLSVTKYCERNTSYRWCFCQGLKICMTFGCNPYTIFCYFFRSSNLLFLWLKAFRHCERNSSHSFSWVFLKLCRCLRQGLKMCMTFGCNPQINFCYLFTSLNIIIFAHKAYRHWVSCEPNLFHKSQFYLDLFNTFQVFCQGLKTCLTFGCNPQIKCCHISRSLNLISFYQSIWALGILWTQLFLQFYLDLSWTLQLFLPRLWLDATWIFFIIMEIIYDYKLFPQMMDWVGNSLLH